jgi:hypothetical protein
MFFCISCHLCNFRHLFVVLPFFSFCLYLSLYNIRYPHSWYFPRNFFLLHLFSCCYPLMSSALSLFAPFFLKKRVWSSCFVWQKLLLLHPLCKRDKVFSWNVDKAPVGFDLCGFTFKKKLLWKFGSEAKKSLSLQSGSQKRIFFCLGLRSC